MPGTLGGHRLAIELPGQSDRELADVDHLLDLAECLRDNLSGLDGHQFGEILLVLRQQLAETGHQCTAHGRRGGAPL